MVVLVATGFVCLLLARWRNGKGVSRPLLRVVAYSLLLLFLSMDCLCVWLVWQLRECRGDLHKIMGNDFQDSEWGFGQVLAVFLWIETIFSLMWQAGTATVRRTRTWRSQRKASQGPGNPWPEKPPGPGPHDLVSEQPQVHPIWEAR
jgi:hypothetical protein